MVLKCTVCNQKLTHFTFAQNPTNASLFDASLFDEILGTGNIGGKLTTIKFENSLKSHLYLGRSFIASVLGYSKLLTLDMYQRSGDMN